MEIGETGRRACLTFRPVPTLPPVSLRNNSFYPKAPCIYQEEIFSRYEIMQENYVKTINIEEAKSNVFHDVQDVPALPCSHT